MHKISIAEVKRFFASNIGREVTAEWPGLMICGNIGMTPMVPKKQKRTVHAVKSNEVQFKTEKGISHLTFFKGDYAYMGEGLIELYSAEGNALSVRYLIEPVAVSV